MTKEDQRIAIAEACGWKLMEAPDHIWFYYKPNTFPRGATPEYELPDFCNDLNAMHEAEKVLSVEQWNEYHEQLVKLDSNLDLPDLVHATASQRAEAFLRCIGKWQEPSSTNKDK